MNKVLLFWILFISSVCIGQNIERQDALEDFEQFIELLKVHSSYYNVSDYDFESHFQSVRHNISSQDSVSILFLAYEIEKIIAETIDRHASVKVEDFEEDGIEMFNLHFPFAIAPFKDKVVALVRNKSTRDYTYYSADYPYVKSINNIPILNFIEEYAYNRKHSPKAAKLYDGTRDLRDIGELFVRQNKLSQKELEIILTNGESDKKFKLPLSKNKYKWINIGHTQDIELIKAAYFDEPFDYHKLDKWIEDSIGYLQLPSMFSYSDFEGLELYFKTVLKKYMNAEALIIDIRGNGGGSREILNSLAGNIVPPEQSPWVANVAYVRNDQQLDEDIESMSSRFLYCYKSEKFNDDDRNAIDFFKNNFKTKRTFDPKKFSEPFFMLLKSNGTPLNYPVYVLTDERSFSAASVFASALKGLPNVKIVGVTTNGSSGRSKKFNLTHSNIRIRLSTMLSFQRNGKTLDGNGTTPDIVIEKNELQLLGKNDSQLEDLIKIIRKN